MICKIRVRKGCNSEHEVVMGVVGKSGDKAGFYHPSLDTLIETENFDIVSDEIPLSSIEKDVLKTENELLKQHLQDVRHFSRLV